MTGRLALKNGLWYAVLSYKDENNQFKQKWINTHLKERGNKKEAQKILNEQLQTFNPHEEKPKQNETKTENILLVDYVEKVFNEKSSSLSPITASAYESIIKIIKIYFKDDLLKDITYKDIERFYDYLRYERKVGNTTVKHYANVLSPAFRQAYRDDLIPKNPFEFLPKIKRDKRSIEFYNKNELEKLFQYTDNTDIGLIVRIAAYYGFRRSEALGLKWKAIDFDAKTIKVEHKVVKVKKILYRQNKLKTEASSRTLPLIPEIEQLLLQRKKEIEKNKTLYGKSYNDKYNEYIFVNDIGDLMLPDHITQKFNRILKQNKLKHIRFHDLRHSCASLLVANNVPMKNIQEWLGHANFNTTADVYSHLDFSGKVKSANIIEAQLSVGVEDEKELEREIEELKKKICEKEQLKKALKLKDNEMN